MGWKNLLIGLPLIAFASIQAAFSLRLLETIDEAGPEARVAIHVVFFIFCLATFFFFRLGAIIAFSVRKTLIDTECETITTAEGLIIPWKKAVSPLAPPFAVEIRSVKSLTPAANSRSEPIGILDASWKSEVRLKSKTLFTLETCKNAHRATEIANSLAEFLQCEIIDKRKPQLMN
jgi:hypothetical protein